MCGWVVYSILPSGSRHADIIAVASQQFSNHISIAKRKKMATNSQESNT